MMHKSVKFFQVLPVFCQFSSFLVEEDAQKAHVSIVFGAPSVIISLHRRQQISFISSIPKWTKTGFRDGACPW
jgi:hypothetical protein